ncbi:hypothetical protein AJ80_03111 [Polytolypa hystricis UAMH7299]|uniref:AB hydrolase-1 domain-containing protein n=1 Tax=Polytolypa hystricis (strain UAMH7299) TaxID=1447883 RepID=A0A2B7YKG4_POLH7|nr:hypothetical protein AJ80_03111 [Polytolypa hystricis UAMH7299]
MASSSTGAEVISLPDGRKLAFDLSGPPESPVILLSNSLLSNFRVWDHFVKVLHSNGFRTLRYDYPGHGHSTTPSDLNSVTLFSLANDVSLLVMAVKLTEVHAYIGVSMGASVGLLFAAQNPGFVKKLIFCDGMRRSPLAAGKEDPFGPRIEIAKAQPDAIETLTESTLERWFGTAWMNANIDETERMREIMNTTTRDGYIACCNALRDKGNDLSRYLEKAGRNVNAAMLVVGEKDANMPETMAEMKKDIQAGLGSKGTVGWAVIKGAGHLPMIDNSKQFNTEVLNFLT